MNSKKNVLLVINSLKLGGGAERVAATIGNELARRNHAVTFFTFKETQTQYPIIGHHYCLNDKPVNNSFSAGLAMTRRARQISRFCFENKIDTVISFMEPANFASVISRVIFSNKTKIICTIHSNPHRFGKLKKLMIKLLYPHSDLIVTVSRMTENILNSDYLIKNTRTVYNPIDTNTVRKLSAESLPAEFSPVFDSHPIFINIGRLEAVKGHFFLIRSFKKVVELYPAAKLVILGDGSLKASLKKLISKLELNNNAFLLGNQDNVFPFLKKSHCFIMSSLWEGLPVSLIEATANGLSVISTDCWTGPREIIAPELAVDKKINYPYRNNQGVLIEPFSLDEYERLRKVNNNNNVLSPPETILSQEMITFIKSEKASPLGDQYLIFDINNILNQWENLL